MSNTARHTRIVIVAKAPLPGQAKTRLIPALGADGAASLAAKMLRATVAEALEAARRCPGLSVELAAAPGRNHPFWRDFVGRDHVGCDYGAARPEQQSELMLVEQGEGDLGQRLWQAAERNIASGQSVILIGTDCPAINADLLQQAAEALAATPAVMAPTADGGYALLGLTRVDESLFADMPWSTDVVAAETLARLQRLGWPVQSLAQLRDIDEPADLSFVPESWLSEIAVAEL